MIPPPTRPLATDTSNPRPTHTDEKRVSRYPVPPNHARNAASDGGLNGETPLPRDRLMRTRRCEAGPMGRTGRDHRQPAHVPSAPCACRQMRDAVPVKVRQMQTAEARSAKHERKETEAEADRETDQIEI